MCRTRLVICGIRRFLVVFLSWIVVILLTSLVAPDVVLAGRFSQLVVFGDSLTDAGNKHSVNSFPPSPPYHAGRHTDGPVWVDYLADELKIQAPIASELGGTNYAWGAATTGAAETRWPDIRSIEEQVQSYLHNHAPSPTDLFVFWGGVNDFFQGQTDAAVVAGMTVNQVSQLIEAGAENFLVTKMPWVGWDPAVQFNRNLSVAMGELRQQHGNVTIVEFEPAIWRTLRERPSDFGLTNIDDPACRDCGSGDRESNPNPIDIVSNPEEYFLWDDIHPTTVVHRHIGLAAFHALIPPGDFDQNAVLDVGDVNLLMNGIASESHASELDLSGDSLVNQHDLRLWVTDLRLTWFGDANLDGEFNSGDLVSVFKVGKYETGQEVGWAEGDWNGDGVFGSGDLVFAFQDGGYEQGLRAAASAVPEPSAALLFALAAMLAASTTRRKRF